MLINNVACHIRVYHIHVLSSSSCTLHLNDMMIRWFYLMPEQKISWNRWNHSPAGGVDLERRRLCVYSSIWIINVLDGPCTCILLWNDHVYMLQHLPEVLFLHVLLISTKPSLLLLSCCSVLKFFKLKFLLFVSK